MADQIIRCGHCGGSMRQGSAGGYTCANCDLDRELAERHQSEPAYYFGGARSSDPLVRVSYEQWRAAGNG